MVDSTDMARGPLMLRLSRGWDTVDSTATVVLVLAMVVMAIAVLDTAMERGLLMLRPSPRPMPGWDTVDSTATVVWVLVMEVMAMVDSDTAMDTQLMAATAMDLDSMARSKQNQIPRLTISY